MKRFFVFFLAVMMLCSMSTVMAASPASDFEYDTYSDGTCYITNYIGTSKDVVIPSYIGSYKVIGFDSEVFENAHLIESVTLPDTMTELQMYAFAGWENLKKVTLPDTIKVIEEEAFGGCTSLTTINLPEGLEEIGEYAFIECVSLKNVIFPKSLRVIGGNAFYNCDSIEEVNIPYNVEEVGYDAFADCDSLEKLTLGFEKSSLGETAFYNCKNLKEVALNGNISESGYDVFYGCDSLEKVSVGNGVISIPDNMFSHCGNLKDVTLPEGLKAIGAGSFSNTAVESIFIPKSVTDFGYSAFTFCENLSEIQIESGDSDYIVEDGVVLDKAKSQLILYPGGKKDTSYVVPSTVSEIAYSAFAGNKYVETVKLPESLEVLGDGAFMECTSLRKANIPSGVQEILNETFAYTALESVEIPEGVTSIGAGAFKLASKLSSVKLPSTLESIHTSAFSGCPELKSIEIPKGVTTIAWMSIGFALRENVEAGMYFPVKMEDFVIKGYSGSEAQKYAEQNGFKFVELSSEVLFGDSDGDGKVSVRDATLIQKSVAGLTSISGTREECSDTDRDGKISVRDATCIQKFIAGIITQL